MTNFDQKSFYVSWISLHTQWIWFFQHDWVGQRPYSYHSPPLPTLVTAWCAWWGSDHENSVPEASCKFHRPCKIKFEILYSHYKSIKIFITAVLCMHARFLNNLKSTQHNLRNFNVHTTISIVFYFWHFLIFILIHSWSIITVLELYLLRFNFLRHCQRNSYKVHSTWIFMNSFVVPPPSPKRGQGREKNTLIMAFRCANFFL